MPELKERKSQKQKRRRSKRNEGRERIENYHVFGLRFVVAHDDRRHVFRRACRHFFCCRVSSMSIEILSECVHTQSNTIEIERNMSSRTAGRCWRWNCYWRERQRQRDTKRENVQQGINKLHTESDKRTWHRWCRNCREKIVNCTN